MTEPTVQSFEGSDLDLDALEAMCHRANAEGNAVIWRYAEVVNPRAVLALISAAREEKGTRAQSHPFAAQESAVGEGGGSGAGDPPRITGDHLAYVSSLFGKKARVLAVPGMDLDGTQRITVAFTDGSSVVVKSRSVADAWSALRECAGQMWSPPSGCERSEQGNPTQAELPPLEQGGEEGAVSCESRAASASPAAPMGERQAGGGEL